MMPDRGGRMGRKVIIIISSIYINRNRESSLLPGTFGGVGSRKKVTQKVAQISGQNVTQKLGPLWGRGGQNAQSWAQS